MGCLIKETKSINHKFLLPNAKKKKKHNISTIGSLEMMNEFIIIEYRIVNDNIDIVENSRQLKNIQKLNNT